MAKPLLSIHPSEARIFLDNFALQSKFSSHEDWYKITAKAFTTNGPSLKLYDNSLQKALRTAYPEYVWHTWKFEVVPKGFWQDQRNQKEFLDWFSKERGIASDEDWKRVTIQDIVDKGGNGLLDVYDRSLYKVLSSIYPGRFNVWSFSKRPRNHLTSTAEARQFLDMIAPKLGVNTMDDWYKVTGRQLKEVGAYKLLPRFGYSLARALVASYPEHTWHVWKFDKVPASHWDDNQNRREFFNFVAQQLGVTKPEGWYNVTLKQIAALGGSGLLRKFNDSVPRAICASFPEYNLKPWQFARAPRGFFDSERNTRDYIDSITKEFQIKSSSDLQAISYKLLSTHKGTPLLRSYKGLLPLLAKYYPTLNAHTKGVATSKTQLLLHKMVQNIFKEYSVQMNYNHPDLLYKDTRKKMQLDVYIPELSLAFEYQGVQHYHSHYLFGSPSEVLKRDQQKRDECRTHNITLISIPYWWNETQSSLLATIAKYRPDLATGKITADPIPETVPDRAPKPFHSLAGFLPVMHSKPWTQSLPVDGWFATSVGSNALRAYWNGKSLFLQNGSEITIPSSYSKHFPNSPLDGHLVWGSHSSEELLEKIRANSLQWGEVQYQIMDLPSIVHLPFEKRIEQLQTFSNAILNVSTWTPVQGSLLKFRSNPEGVYLRKPRSFYFEENSFLKATPQQESYAVVTLISSDSVECKRTNGQQIIIQKPSVDISIGDVIAIRYNGVDTNGALQSPMFHKLRRDVKWFNECVYDMYPYFVVSDKQGGHCRGCGVELKDKSQPRIQSIVYYKPPGLGPYPATASMCLNFHCVEQAIRLSAKKGRYLPPFNGQVAVDSSKRDMELPKLNLIHYNFL